jgi:hypothetical protein
MPFKSSGGGEQRDIYMILVCLPSMDVARERLASGTFTNVTLPDFFGLSRFSPEREFRHVFEARQFSLRAGRWR